MDGESVLEQRLEIETPERVVIVHDLAGIGSRFAAGCVDACILTIPWCGASCVTLALFPNLGGMKPDEMQAVGLATVGSCYAILWLYYLLFETFGGGRTPGKRVLRLRVMSVHGGPAPVSAIVLRNVLRVVDALPTLFPPMLGGIVMFLTRRAQRIGDLAAGTVVVRERAEELAVARVAAEPEDAADGISPADLAEVRRFLDRRGEMLAGVRRDVARRLAERLAAAYDLPRVEPEKLLGLLGAGRTPRHIRDLTGPRLAPAEAPPPPPEAAP